MDIVTLLPLPSPIPELPNLRDLGGWRTADGRTVKTGRLFRSTDFRSLTRDTQSALAPLGLRTVYDLRAATERATLPDPVLAGVTEIPLDVLADEKTALPGNLGQVLTDPAVAHRLTEETEGKVIDLMIGTYRQFITMPSANIAYRRFYLGLLGENEVPALFHCTTGKDRTGWAAASFLSLMGVERDDVYLDYLETNKRLLPALQPLFDAFTAAGGNPALLHPLLGVDELYLDAAFTSLEENYGTLSSYFETALGIDADAQSTLRERYLVG